MVHIVRGDELMLHEHGGRDGAAMQDVERDREDLRPAPLGK
jgi:hypothetical protein